MPKLSRKREAHLLLMILPRPSLFCISRSLDCCIFPCQDTPGVSSMYASLRCLTAIEQRHVPCSGSNLSRTANHDRSEDGRLAGDMETAIDKNQSFKCKVAGDAQAAVDIYQAKVVRPR